MEEGGDEKGQDNEDDELLMASEKYEKSGGGGYSGSHIPLVANTSTGSTGLFSSMGKELNKMGGPVLNDNGQGCSGGQGGTGGAQGGSVGTGGSEGSGGGSNKDVVQAFVPMEASSRSLNSLIDAIDRTSPSSGQGSGSNSFLDDEENIQSMSLASYHAFTNNRK